MVVTSSVAIAGVLLVFSFLIIPAAIGVMFASSPARQLAIGWITGTLTSAAGLAVSFAFDLPTGAAMVCTFGGALAVAGLLYPFLRGNRHKALRVAIVTVRWCAAALLAGSALQLAAAPRADQPLLDAIEYAVPSLRTLYFSRSEAATFAEASEYAERHRTAAERLNDLEKRNRTEGEALDDFSIGRISSFLKSYGEMRQGEHFVMGEVRARARERVRWGASLGVAGASTIVCPDWLAKPTRYEHSKTREARVIDQLKEKVNADAALTRRGRFLTTTFLIEVGPAQWLVSIVEGKIASVTQGPFVMPSWSFALRASRRSGRNSGAPTPARLQRSDGLDQAPRVEGRRQPAGLHGEPALFQGEPGEAARRGSDRMSATFEPSSGVTCISICSAARIASMSRKPDKARRCCACIPRDPTDDSIAA